MTAYVSNSIDILKGSQIILTVTFVAFSVYFYNDLTDLKEDIKNRELGNPIPANRPLGKELITEDRLKTYIVLSGVAGLLFAYSINLLVFELQLLCLVLGYLYSAEPVRLKKRFMLKQGTIAIGTILVILTGTLAAGGITPAIMFMLLLQFIICMGINPIMDVRDMRGDRIMGIKTIPVIWGPAFTVRLYFASIILIGIATLLGYSSIKFNTAMPILTLLVLGTWIYVTYPLLKRWDDPKSVHLIVINKMFPMYLALQVLPLVGVMALPF